MGRGRAAVALLFLTMLLPAGQPQGAADSPLRVLDDVVGDAQGAAAGGPTQAMPARFEALDLVGLDVMETADEIHLTLQVADLDAPGELFIVDDTVYYVAFNQNDQRYAVQINRALADQQYFWANLFKQMPDGQGFNWIRFIAPTADPGADTISLALLREDLIDTQGAAPLPGRTLNGFAAFAHLRMADQPMIQTGSPGFTCCQFADAWDTMPDDGQPAGEVEIQLGLRQSGHAELFSPTPMRASNGEATTFVYTVTASNTGDASDTFEMVAMDAPEDWAVVIPDRFVRVEGGGSIDIPVLVTTPFSHIHGEVRTLMLEMRSTTDSDSIGRIELGVRYHAVPQPAGHHPMMWFHSQRFGEDTTFFPVTDNLFAGNGGFTYLNTLETDDRDQRVPVKGNYWGYGFHNGFPQDTEPKAMWRWFVYLQPGLEMGLDFDLDGSGTISIPIQTTLPLPQASMHGEMLHWGYDERSATWTRTVVAELMETDRVDIGPSGDYVFGFEFHIQPEADRIPFMKRAYFGVELNLTSARPALFTGVEAPEMSPGGTMTLPLFEYTDAVDDVFTSLDELHFMTSEQERMANPGDVIVFEGMLHNAMAEAATFHIDVQGTNKDWVAMVSPRHFELAPDGGQTVRIAVLVPDDAEQHELADLIVTASDVDEPARRALLRFVAHVMDGDHASDDALWLEMQGAETKDAPSAGLILVVGLLAALAVAAGRRP